MLYLGQDYPHHAEVDGDSGVGRAAVKEGQRATRQLSHLVYTYVCSMISFGEMCFG